MRNKQDEKYPVFEYNKLSDTAYEFKTGLELSGLVTELRHDLSETKDQVEHLQYRIMQLQSLLEQEKRSSDNLNKRLQTTDQWQRLMTRLRPDLTYELMLSLEQLQEIADHKAADKMYEIFAERKARAEAAQRVDAALSDPDRLSTRTGQVMSPEPGSGQAFNLAAEWNRAHDQLDQTNTQATEAAEPPKPSPAEDDTYHRWAELLELAARDREFWKSRLEDLYERVITGWTDPEAEGPVDTDAATEAPVNERWQRQQALDLAMAGGGSATQVISRAKMYQEFLDGTDE